MRIIIDIDGDVVTVRTERTGAETEYVSEVPPPEVLRAAARLGATSAGPAPRAGKLVEAGPDALRALGETFDGGFGPFAPPGISVPKDEEEDATKEEVAQDEGA
jgi:hypothetical protein